MLTQVPDPREFGVAELDETRAGHRPGGEAAGSRRATSRWSACTSSVPRCIEAVRNLKPSWRGELEITEAIQWLIDHGNTVRSSVISGYWKDTGNVTDMLEVNRMVLETAEPRQRRHRGRRVRDHRPGR